MVRDPETLKTLVRDLYGTVYERQDFDAVPEFYTADAVRHGGLQGRLEGREALREYLQGSLGGLSDIEISENHCLVDGDLVAYDFDMEATHSGEMLGAPATGNRFRIANAALFRVENDRVTDEWPRTDVLGLLEGIGLVDGPL